ncbi:Uncharacterised protein [Serratia fonticola]|nr:Uncharacterised protein [Serratia fonticola]
MNLYNEISMKLLLENLSVPSGWMVSKNNLIDSDVSILNNSVDPDEQFLIRENFFSSCMFYSSCEIHTNNNMLLKAVVDVGCTLYEDDMSEISSSGVVNYNCVKYDITLSLFKGKSKNNIFIFTDVVDTRNKMVSEINFLMKFFSFIVIDAIDEYGANIDFDNYLELARKKYPTS